MDGLVIMLLSFPEVGQLKSRMLVHRTRELVMRCGYVEGREDAGEWMLVSVIVVWIQNVVTFFGALVVLFVEEKVLQLPEFVRVWVESGHALYGGWSVDGKACVWLSVGSSP